MKNPTARQRADSDLAELENARESLIQQARMLELVAGQLDDRFCLAVDRLTRIGGHVVVSGVGKSGQIGRKIASTMSSTGTPAFFVNAGEAAHGDLGMITERDALLLISYSGRTVEVLRMLPFVRAMGAPTVALVGNLGSPLARDCDVALEVGVEREACPHNLAPTTSSLTSLAVGDALALALARRSGFDPETFARRHPGGPLGDKLTRRVSEVMRRRSPRVQGWDLPIVAPSCSVTDCLMTMTTGRLGLVLAMDGERLLGILTDGDLRRCLQSHDGRLDGLRVDRVMTPNPLTIREDATVAEAHDLMVSRKVTALVVVDDEDAVTGVVQVFEVE